MKLRMPFAYEVIRREARRDVRKAFAEWLEVEVPEVEEADAPVIASWLLHEGAGDSYRTFCRRVGDQHYVQPGAAAVSQQDLIVGEVFPGPGDVWVHAAVHMRGYSREQSEAAKTLIEFMRSGLAGDLTDGEPPRDGEGVSEREDALRHMSEFRLIGGSLWMPCREPRLRLRVHRTSSFAILDMSTDYGAYHGDTLVSYLFPADGMDQIEEFASRVGNVDRRYVYDIRLDLEVEFSDDTVSETAVIESARLAERFKSAVGDMASDAVEAWLAMRDVSLGIAAGTVPVGAATGSVERFLESLVDDLEHGGEASRLRSLLDDFRRSLQQDHAPSPGRNISVR